MFMDQTGILPKKGRGSTTANESTTLSISQHYDVPDRQSGVVNCQAADATESFVLRLDRSWTENISGSLAIEADTCSAWLYNYYKLLAYLRGMARGACRVHVVPPVYLSVPHVIEERDSPRFFSFPSNRFDNTISLSQ